MNTVSKPKEHLWQGEWIDDAQLQERLLKIDLDVQSALSMPFSLNIVLDTCDRLSAELKNDESKMYWTLSQMLKTDFQMEYEERTKELAELASFLSRADLERKVECELGSLTPWQFQRQDFRRNEFEAWRPLGFLVHIAPTNAFSAGAWSVLEGLLAGNVNFLKTGGSDKIFAQVFLKFLCDEDASQTIARRIFACKIPSSNKEQLKSVLSKADGIIVWGDEGAISGIRELSPLHARFIDWGPKISFAYFAHESLNDPNAIDGLAFEVCRMEQQACSSPQCVYVETNELEELVAFANRLATSLERVSATIPLKSKSIQEQAEITSIVELCRLESCSGLSQLIESPGKTWRILLEYSNLLKASPLFRTIWLKPLLRSEIVPALHPFRHFLQTAGLACGKESINELTESLVNAGILRISTCGKMLESYSGEPHDGVYALQRYSKKVSIQTDETLLGISSFAELQKGSSNKSVRVTSHPIMQKEDFQNQQVEEDFAQLFFKSGGSSGEPKLSIFSYTDYHKQMETAAFGLYAAGLDVQRDRCMNLFFAGSLYGGFVSFWTILERLQAVQFPMAGIADLKLVAETIVKQKCNVILGMPSYIIQLFQSNKELLEKTKVIEKIFFAGEHFAERQRKHIQETFGVKLIKSCGYGSVDAGPIGFQCNYCEGSIYHLHQSLQNLEILKMLEDLPVQTGEPGRVVLSSLQRRGQKIARYEIGDMARQIVEPCKCGRSATKFELLGRYGDVFKAGSCFFSYAKFSQLLADKSDFTGEFQIILTTQGSDGVDKLTVSLGKNDDTAELHRKQTEQQIERQVLENYADLNEMVYIDKLLLFSINLVPTNELIRAQSSGKLLHVLDNRKQVRS